MTIAIGLIIKGARHRQGAIVFASDSQTTYPGGQKRLDAKKINVVEFGDAQVLVAQAGSAELADKAIEIMRRNAKGIMLESEETAPQIAKQAVREIRNHLKELNEGCGFTFDDWLRFWREENSFSLMLGFYFGGKPFIFSLDMESCLPVKLKTSFQAIGCGKYIAEFLLAEYSAADPEFEYGYPAVISVVQKTIDNVEGCNRLVWAGVAVRTPPSVWAEYEKLIAAYKSNDQPLANGFSRVWCLGFGVDKRVICDS